MNDEVIVAFINDDPRHAIVLGMLNSSAKPVLPMCFPEKMITILKGCNAQQAETYV